MPSVVWCCGDLGLLGLVVFVIPFYYDENLYDMLIEVTLLNSLHVLDCPTRSLARKLKTDP